jgi:hypothetical protein
VKYELQIAPAKGKKKAMLCKSTQGMNERRKEVETGKRTERRE